MTFTGFIITSAVIFVVFYAWYTYVHRNGESTSLGLEDVRVNNLHGRRQALMAETGEIEGDLSRGDRPHDHLHTISGTMHLAQHQETQQPSQDTMDRNSDVELAKDELRFASQTGYMTEFGSTFGENESSMQQSATSSTGSQVNSGRMEGVFPPPDVEFAPMPLAEFQNLSNQLPVADDTVMFKEQQESK